MDTTKDITVEEFTKEIFLTAGFVMIQKDTVNKMQRGLYILETMREGAQKVSSTGIIIAKSVIPCQEKYDRFIFELYKIGDRVGFDSMVPHLSPIPPTYKIVQGGQEEDPIKLVIMHATDILALITDIQQRREEYGEKIGSGWWKYFSEKD